MNLYTEQQYTLDRLNGTRRLYNLVISPSFIQVYDSSKDKERVLRLIHSQQNDKVFEWYKEQRETIIQFMSVDKLRLECRLAGVKNYHLLQREEMIGALAGDHND